MNRRGIRWVAMGWSHLALDREEWRGCFEYGNEFSGTTKC
jgi:hypothetical protein